MKKLIIWIVLAQLSLMAAAQDTGFSADRPGVVSDPGVLPKGRLQWETGMIWEFDNLSGNHAHTWTVNESLLRWGFSGFAELMVQGAWCETFEDGRVYDGLDVLAIGAKAKLFEGWKAVPAISLFGNVLVPGGGNSAYLPEHVGGQMGLVFQNKLTSWLALNYEADLIWMDESRPTVFFGLAFGFTLNDRLSLVVEEYNHNTAKGTECKVGLGLGYQVASRVQLDMGANLSLNHFTDYCCVSLGVSWQITK